MGTWAQGSEDVVPRGEGAIVGGFFGPCLCRSQKEDGTAWLSTPLFNSYLVQDPARGIVPLPVTPPWKHLADTPSAVPQYTPLKSFWVPVLQPL